MNLTRRLIVLSLSLSIFNALGMDLASLTGSLDEQKSEKITILRQMPLDQINFIGTKEKLTDERKRALVDGLLAAEKAVIIGKSDPHNTTLTIDLANKYAFPEQEKILLDSVSLTGSALCMEQQKDYGATGWALKQVATDNMVFNNVPSHYQHLTKAELRTIISQSLEAITYEGEANTPSSVTIDFDKIPALTNKVRPQDAPGLARRLFTQGVPLVAAVGLGYFIAKKMNTEQ